MHGHDARPAGGAGPGVGHHGGAALVPGRDESRPAGDQRVRDVEVAAADHTEHDLGAELGQPLPDRVRDPHAQLRSTRASARHGEPEPPTMGSGLVITTAPVMGSRARFCSWVRPYLPAPSRRGMARERRVEGVRGPGVRADGLGPEPDDRRLLGQPGRARDADSGGVRARLVGVEELGLVVGTGVPARAVQQPAALGQRPVGRLPLLDVVDLEQEVRIGGRFRAEVEHHGRGDQPRHRHLGHVLAVLAGNPVHRGVEVRAGVLAGRDVVPVPGGAALVIVADLGQPEPGRVTERRWQLDDRRTRRQRRGEVDHLHRTVTDRVGQGVQHGHVAPSFGGYR